MSIITELQRPFEKKIRVGYVFLKKKPEQVIPKNSVTHIERCQIDLICMHKQDLLSNRSYLHVQARFVVK